MSYPGPPSRLYRKGPGKEAKLYHGGHALMDAPPAWAFVGYQCNGSRYEVAMGGSGADAEAPGEETTAAKDVGMIEKRQIAQHIVASGKRPGGSAVAKPIRKRKGYTINQRVRKRIEEIFGWMKTIGGMRKTCHKDRARTQLAAEIVGTAYNLLRIAKLKPDLGMVVG